MNHRGAKTRTQREHRQEPSRSRDKNLAGANSISLQEPRDEPWRSNEEIPARAIMNQTGAMTKTPTGVETRTLQK